MAIELVGSGIPGVFLVPAGGATGVLQAQGDILDDLNTHGAAGASGAIYYATRAAFVTGDPTVPAGGGVQAGGLAYLSETGATEIADLAGWVPAGVRKAGHYGMVGDGATDNSAIDLPNGKIIDFDGGVYVMDAMPDHCIAWNGTIKIGTTLYPLPKQAPKHPLDGQVATVMAQGDMAIHTGPVWHEPAENRVWRAWSQSHQHAPDYGMAVQVQYSDDGGNSYSGPVTVFCDKDLKVTAMCGRLMGSSRFGLMINTEDSSGVRALRFVYSDDLGDNWTDSGPIEGLTVNHFLYFEMIDYPTSVGGDDDTGFAVFTYVSNVNYKIATADNGATWTQSVFYNGAGAGYAVNELTIARINGEDKWVGYIRGESTYLAFTSTNLSTITVTDSGIDNSGSQGHPPYAICEGGRYYLYQPLRENWGGTAAETRAAQLVYYEADAAALFAADGVFPDKTAHIAAYLPGRALGMLFSCKTPFGRIAQLRGNETTYTGAGTDAIRNDLLQISRIQQSVATPAFVRSLRPGRNLLHNPTFDLWRPQYATGVAVTGLTGSTTPFAQRWKLFHSGATFDVTKEVVDYRLSRNLSFRPAFGARLEGTGGDNSGFQQTHYGEDVLRHWSDRLMTAQIFGVGLFPAEDVPRLNLIYEYGTGGAPSDDEQVTVDFAYVGQSDGVWSAVAQLRSPTMASKTFGSAGNARATIRIDCGSATDAWDVLIVGAKLEFGDTATPLEMPDGTDETTRSARYFEAIGLAPGVVGIGCRESDTQISVGLHYSSKIIVPSLSSVGTVGNYVLDSKIADPGITGVSFDRIGKASARALFVHGSTTGYDAAEVHSSSSSTWIEVDCEPAT